MCVCTLPAGLALTRPLWPWKSLLASPLQGAPLCQGGVTAVPPGRRPAPEKEGARLALRETTHAACAGEWGLTAAVASQGSPRVGQPVTDLNVPAA